MPTLSFKEKLRPLLRWARLLFIPLSLCLIGIFIWQSRGPLTALLRNGEWIYLLAALLLWIASNLLAPLLATCLFRASHIEIPYSTCLRIHCQRLPAKYLPGGIWHSVGRANDYLGLGHSAGKVGIYFLLENFLLIMVTLLLSTRLVGPLVKAELVQWLIAVLPVVCGAALLVFPYVSKRLSKGKMEFTYPSYCMAIVLMCIYWGIAGLSFTCYISAFPGLALDVSAVQTMAIYIFSWCLGYLAVFAPQGIGVAEFISSYLLAGNAALQIVGLLAGFRLLVLLGDLSSWALNAVLKHKP